MALPFPWGLGAHRPVPGLQDPALMLGLPSQMSEGGGRGPASSTRWPFSPVPTACPPSSEPLHLLLLEGPSAVANSPHLPLRPTLRAGLSLPALCPHRARLPLNRPVLLPESF